MKRAGGLIFLTVFWAQATLAVAAGSESAQREFFETRIRPVLATHCYECHSHRAEKLKAGLLLDRRSGLLKGGERGPAVEPGRADASLLIRAVSYADVDLQMPPRTRLPERAVEDLKKWIADGAWWPQEKEPEGGAAPAGGIDLQQRRADHWSWKPLQNPPVPAVRDAGWARDPLDRFVLAKIESAGLAPAPDADPRARVRRLSFAVRGLPPDPADVEQFAADPSPAAWQSLVDRYLADPAYGEHWARHWLDLVRYAETNGHEFDYSKSNPWRYRDYVVRALNADVPYRQFVREHIAGDLLPSPRLDPATGANESILGTGFWFLGEWVHSPVDIRQDEGDRFENMIDVMSKTFLGLTVACARCHDHKFDAIRAEDFYALQGYLQSSHQRLVRYETTEHNREVAGKLRDLDAAEGGAVVQAWFRRAEAGLQQVGPYLRAAIRPMGSDEIDALAQREQLDAGRLRLWAAELDRASQEPGHPLHPLGLIRSGKKPAAVGAPVPPLSPEVLGDVVVNYLQADRLIQDGYSFQLARPGEPFFDASAGHGLAGVQAFGAARRSADWLKLQSVDSDRDVGALKKHDRSGKTLFTPTFELKHPRVHYLVQGKGSAFACVDSHRMLEGPLHGETLMAFDAEGPQPKWVTHNLGRLIDHRLHVELAPESESFQVLAVVQGDAARAVESLLMPPPLWGQALQEERAASDEGRIEAMADQLQRAARHLAESKGMDASEAAVADWIVKHPELFFTETSRRELASETAAFRDKRRELAGGIRRESRTAMAMIDGSPENEYIFLRGSWKSRGPDAPRHFLEALGGKEIPPSESGSGRLSLADQMTDPRRNPFIARVIVNRLWHHLFGRGIVPTPDDFGVLGLPPTHPELLDHLADRFVTEDGWSIKAHLRRLLLSRAWNQSAEPGPAEAQENDPDNRLWHRAMRRRLSGEQIRDAVLQVSGRIDRTPGGPPVPVHLTDFMTGRGRPGSGPVDGAGRRSLYLGVRRNFLSPMMLAFDTPIPFSTMGRRSVSNVPAQALILMNDPFVADQARLWAEKILAAPAPDAAQRIKRMYEQALSRPATESEVQAALEFLGPGAADAGRWTALAHVVFNLKEFVFLR